MRVAGESPDPPGRAEGILGFQAIGKSFSGVPVLRDVTFGLGAGRVLGLIGENGAGKSTLMNILGGVLQPDGGRMVLSGAEYAPADPLAASEAGIAFIHQELNLFTNLSIAENIFIARFPRKARHFLDRRAMRSQAAVHLAAVDLDLPPETLVAGLSQGERQLVEIARALAFEARIIILDEPTTSLTPPESARLFDRIERLRVRGISMIYISHILGDILRLCDDIVVLRDGAVVGSGPARGFSIDRMVSLMVGRTIDQIYPPRTRTPSTSPVLEARGLSHPGILEDIGFSLHQGEVLGVFGLLGSGRTELARILFGLDPCESGEVLVGGAVMPERSPRESIRRGLAFLTENRREEGLILEATIAENIALVSLPSFARSRWGFLDRGRMRAAVARAGERVRLQSGLLERRAARTLSGGNQQKAVLAKWLLAGPSVLILDEPTRGIDVGAKHEVYRLMNELAAGGAGILFIASEIEEILGMCDRIIVLHRGEIRETLARPQFDREKVLRAALGTV